VVHLQKTISPNNFNVPPHNIEAEKAILGGILINNDAINQTMDILSPDDFYKESHSHLFEGMVTLYNENEPIDLITVTQILATKNMLDKSGGNDYIISLIESVATSAGIAFHAKIVKDLSIRRKLINKCAIISESCFQNMGNTELLLEQAEQSIYDLAEDQIKQGFESLNDVVVTSFKKLESISDADGDVTGVPTDFKDFDRLTAGLQPSDLIIIAGRPSMGKTAFALNISYNAAKKMQKGVAIFSLEMSMQQLGIRLLGADSGIDATKLRTGRLGSNDWGRLRDSANQLSELPIFIDDSSGLSVLEMKAKCRRLKKSGDLALIIIDYMQLIQGRYSVESRQLEMSEISRMLKALAKDLDVPVIALSQLNRKVEDRPNNKPQLSDLRESGAIEQDADVIVFIYKDKSSIISGDVAYENIINIDIAKQRNGPTGTFKLTFQKEITRFRDYIEEIPSM